MKRALRIVSARGRVREVVSSNLDDRQKDRYPSDVHRLSSFDDRRLPRHRMMGNVSSHDEIQLVAEFLPSAFA